MLGWLFPLCIRMFRYNKTLLDPYWNTREQTFTMHALYLMTRWMLVADIWWMRPEKIRPNETSIQFANRVKALISDQAGLKNLSWDGYLKNFMAANEQLKLRKKAQIYYGSSLKKRLQSGRLSPSLEVERDTATQNGDNSARKTPAPCSFVSKIKRSISESAMANGNIDTRQYLSSFDFPNWLSFDTVIEAKNSLLKSSYIEPPHAERSVSDVDPPTSPPQRTTKENIIKSLFAAREDIVNAWKSSKRKEDGAGKSNKDGLSG